MAYFPFCIDIQGKECLVIGGGKIALQKIQVLVQFEACIKVVSPSISKDITAIKETLEEDNISLYYREFQETDIDGCLFVIAATNDEALNTRISKLCRDRNILVNVVDVKEECSFIFPAVIKKKELLIAVSSSGASPALTVKTKERIEAAIPDYYPELMEQLGDIRSVIRVKVANQKDRKKVYQDIIALAEQNCGSITEEEIEAILSRYLLQQKGECME